MAPPLHMFGHWLFGLRADMLRMDMSPKRAHCVFSEEVRYANSMRRTPAGGREPASVVTGSAL